MNRLRAAAGVTRVWSRLYTCGMASEAAAERRAEIDADLWELQHDQTRSGITPAAQVFARLLTGIPDDLAWRIDCAIDGDDLLLRRTAVGLVAGLALFAAVLCIPNWHREFISPRVAACVLTAPPAQSAADFRIEIVTCAGAFFNTGPRHQR